jgi:hypothetical protein
VGDARLEGGELGEFLVHVHGVEITGNAGEEIDIRFGDRLGERCGHPDLKLVVGVSQFDSVDLSHRFPPCLKGPYRFLIDLSINLWFIGNHPGNQEV